MGSRFVVKCTGIVLRKVPAHRHWREAKLCVPDRHETLPRGFSSPLLNGSRAWHLWLKAVEASHQCQLLVQISVHANFTANI
jgi:hypothetical protein